MPSPVRVRCAGPPAAIATWPRRAPGHPLPVLRTRCSPPTIPAATCTTSVMRWKAVTAPTRPVRWTPSKHLPLCAAGLPVHAMPRNTARAVQQPVQPMSFSPRLSSAAGPLTFVTPQKTVAAFPSIARLMCSSLRECSAALQTVSATLLRPAQEHLRVVLQMRCSPPIIPAGSFTTHVIWRKTAMAP